MKKRKVVEYVVKKIADDVIDLAKDGIDFAKEFAKVATESYLHGYKDEKYEDTELSVVFNFLGGDILLDIGYGLHILPPSLSPHFLVLLIGVTGLPFCTSYLSKKYKEVLSSYSESDRNKG